MGTQTLKEIIKTTVVQAYGPENKDGWIFDFRSILLNPEHLNLVTDALWEKIKDRDHIQIGGLESAAIPLVTSLVLRAHQEGKRVNGFYVRKSRKKSGLFKDIEGELNDDPIILVDDLINFGTSKYRLVEVLEALGKTVDTVLTVVRFRDHAYYAFLNERTINIENLFTLDDFDLDLGEHEPPKYNPHTRLWYFNPEGASHQHVVPKSAPLLYRDRLYYGTDGGTFYALNAKGGEVAWSLTMGYRPEGKSIFSSPCAHDGVVYFGSYDGKLYAVDAENGTTKWVFTDCEWIGSSPALAPELGLVFIGLEHGLPGRRGSVVALALETGEKRWEYDMSALTHASPTYIAQHEQVCIGGNEGVLHLFDAKTGELIWKFETEGGQRYDGISGFSPGDIKLYPVYDAKRDRIAFGSIDGHLYVLDRKDGTLHFRAHTEYYDTDVRHQVWGAPAIAGDTVVFTSTDKHIYAHDLNTGDRLWEYETNGRIFATPVINDGIVYVGSNDGRLYELDLKTGKVRATTQFTERITTKVVVTTDTLYVPTNACEVYALKRQNYKM